MNVASRILIALAIAGCWAVFGVTHPATALGPAAGATAVSVSSQGQRLQSVLNDIARTTGYSIKITEGWSDIPVTVTIEKAPLASTLNRVLKAVGSTNHAVSIRDTEKTVRITMFGKPPAHVSSAGLTGQRPPASKVSPAARPVPSAEDDDPSNPYLTPPLEPGGKGARASEVQAIASLESGADQAAVAATPPLFPGGPAITNQELEALMAQEASDQDPETVEVVPGVTLKQFNDLVSASPPPEDADPVIVPGGKGEAPIRASALAGKAPQAPSDTDPVAPPGRDGEQAMTVGELNRLTSSSPESGSPPRGIPKR